MKGGLQASCATFVCRVCLRGPTQMTGAYAGLDVGNGTVLEKVGEFCYLGGVDGAPQPW